MELKKSLGTSLCKTGGGSRCQRKQCAAPEDPGKMLQSEVLIVLLNYHSPIINFKLLYQPAPNSSREFIPELQTTHAHWCHMIPTTCNYFNHFTSSTEKNKNPIFNALRRGRGSVAILYQLNPNVQNCEKESGKSCGCGLVHWTSAKKADMFISCSIHTTPLLWCKQMCIHERISQFWRRTWGTPWLSFNRNLLVLHWFAS